jgi:tight adherence protein C
LANEHAKLIQSQFQNRNSKIAIPKSQIDIRQSQLDLPMSAEFTDYAIPALIFLVISSGFFSLVYRVMQDRKPARAIPPVDDLLWESEEENRKPGNLTPALAAQLPIPQADRKDLEKELRTAGYFGRRALLEYAAVRTILVLTPLAAAGILALGVDNDQMWKVFAVGVVLAMLGYSLPRVYLYLRGRERTRRLENALPVAVDMLTLCITAGQTLMAALDRVARELKPAHPIMAAELAITQRHAQLSNLPHALRQLADRVPVGETRNLALILSQAERLGSETGPALLEYASNIRTGLKQRADSRANQAMFWMLFPTILCLWIPAAILLVGPAILEFRSERQKIMAPFKDSRQRVKEILQGKSEKQPEQTARDMIPESSTLTVRE